MNLRKWNSIGAGAVACCAFTLAGCGDDDSGHTHDHADGDADHSHTDDDSTSHSETAGDPGGGGGEDEEYSQLTPESFQQVKDMMTLQLSGPIASVDSLRKIEAEHPDAQLKDIIAQIDAKIAEAQAMLDNATVSNGSKTLQIDLPQTIGEANELAAIAMNRVQEVLRAEVEGGGGG